MPTSKFNKNILKLQNMTERKKKEKKRGRMKTIKF